MKCLRRTATLSLTCALVCLAAACSNEMKMANPKSKRNHPRSIAVRINGVPVFWADVDRRARGFLKDEQEINHLAFAPGQEAEALDHFRRRAVKIEVMRHLLLEEAKKNKVVIGDRDRRRALERLQPLMARRNWTTNDFFTRSPLGEERTRLEFEESLYIDKLLADVVTAQVAATPEEMEAAAAAWSRTRAEKVRQIGVLHAQVVAGADFAQLAASASECPVSRGTGGALGEFARGGLDPDVERLVFALKPGEPSPVTETKDGFHIFKVTAHNPPRPATATTPALPETVALSHILLRFRAPKMPEIRQQVIREKAKKRADGYFRALVAEAAIECPFAELTFDDLIIAR